MNIEQRVRLIIGDLMVSNLSLQAQLEDCQQQLAAATAKLAELEPVKDLASN